MNSNDEFIKAMQSIELLPELILEYRLHYNDHGGIYMCTMANHPENTQYLVVNKETYENYFRYKIQKGALKLIDTASKFRVQLASSTQGYAVVKSHAGILLESNDEFKDVEYYDTVD